jgi:TrmH family RNA methyltransferase
MVQYPVLDAEALAQVDAERVLVLVDLRKPGNIGALLRTADATGFRAVLLVDTSVDIYNPNVIRSSTGASFLHNIYDVTSQEAAAFLEARGYRTLAAVVDGETSLFETNLRGKTAVILGTEDHGLPDFWMKNATQCVRIPMVGSLSDSLNVSVSGAVMMYEVLRQQQ